MDGKPTKPPQIAFTIFKHGGGVEKMAVAYRMTGPDTGEDYLIVWYRDSTRAEIRYPADFYEVTEWRGSWPELMRLKEKYRDQVKAYLQWEADNEAELAELKRLTKKFKKDPQP